MGRHDLPSILCGAGGLRFREESFTERDYPANRVAATGSWAGYYRSITSRVHAWDEVWWAVEEAGVVPDYRNPGGPWLPIGENEVHYGQMVVDRVEVLRQTRLTTGQILSIAELIRTVAKACLVAEEGT